jgi:hypothetical protein
MFAGKQAEVLNILLTDVVGVGDVCRQAGGGAQHSTDRCGGGAPSQRAEAERGSGAYPAPGVQPYREHQTETLDSAT